MSFERGIISLLTIVLDLTRQTIITLLSTTLTTQYITHALSPPSTQKLNQIFRNSPRRSTPLPMVDHFVEILEDVFRAASFDNTMKFDQPLSFCNYFDVGMLKTTNMMNEVKQILVGMIS